MRRPSEANQLNLRQGWAHNEPSNTHRRVAAVLDYRAPRLVKMLTARRSIRSRRVDFARSSLLGCCMPTVSVNRHLGR
jgi:hypothetical protein